MSILLSVLAATVTAAGSSQQFVFTGQTIHGHGGKMTVTASGPISGAGVGFGVHLRDGSDRTTIRLAKGTVVIHSRQTSVSAKPDLRTCTAEIVERGVFQVTGGTAAYAGAAGKGTFVRRSHLVGARNASGVCLGRKAIPAAVYDHIRLTGTTTLG